MPGLIKRVNDDSSDNESDCKSILSKYENVPTLVRRVDGSSSDESDYDTFAGPPPIAKRCSSKRKSNTKGTSPPPTHHKTKSQPITKPINTKSVPYRTKS